jgi:capsid protein
MPSSACADRDWAQMADQAFQEWASRKTYDIREEMTFFESQKVVLPDVMCDGDAGAAPVRDFDGNPRVQHFPSDVIGDSTGTSIFGNGTGRWRDGILRNAVGTPVAYRVLRDPVERMRDPASRAYWDYPAKGFWHIGRNDRINANRPLPWIHHGDQSALNILDLNILEMQAAKLNSYFAAAIKTAEGGHLPEGIREMLTAETETVDAGLDSDGAPQTKQVERTYLNLMGGAGIPVLEPGEELQFFKNERPSTTFAGFIDYLVADIAHGFGVPKQFVWGVTGLAGPHARLVLQQADWFFADCAEMLVVDYCQPIWEAFVADAMNRRLLPPPAPGTNWRAVQWQGPGSLTIDKGRDGKMYLEMVASGMARRTAWHEMTGRDGKTELRKTVAEVRYIMELCREAGVPVEYVLGKQASQAPALSATDPDEAAEELVEAMRRA